MICFVWVIGGSWVSFSLLGYATAKLYIIIFTRILVSSVYTVDLSNVIR